IQPQGKTVSIGAEIGHIGGKNSTAEDLIAFMDGYLALKESSLTGIAKISAQTGTSHGGIPLPDGTIAKVQLDFGVLESVGKVAREKYHVGGAVQHGASTLPNELFNEFPKHKTLEIHLATGFQNIVYDTMPKELSEKISLWLEENCKNESEEGWNKEQFIYKTRKKALGPFKKDLWMLAKNEKEPILSALKEQFRFLFDKLGVFQTKLVVDTYVSTGNNTD
ncbi:MAG: class II fructose-bisphosphate aldolase, partial [Candidatus Levyibacteriota bacterium]